MTAAQRLVTLCNSRARAPPRLTVIKSPRRRARHSGGCVRTPPGPAGIGLDGDSPFSDPLAVEAWDARFRWREGGVLRDLTVEATWQRVADALAMAEPRQAALWSRRYFDAFSGWRLLPCASILQHAGTTAGIAHVPAAALNLAAFVQAPGSPYARFDTARFGATAHLAVRMLDDMLQLQGGGAGVALRIGLIGCADALHLLGLRYDSAPARAQARSIARALCEGCLAGTVELAAERGGRADAAAMATVRLQARELPAGLAADVRRHGVRHPDTTAVDRHPWLALFANNVADALDPLAGDATVYRIETADGYRDIRSPGAALTLAQRRAGAGTTRGADTLVSVAPKAQLQLRAAMQPWIDQPIDHSMTVAAGLGATAASADAQARHPELPIPACSRVDPLLRRYPAH